ncbi:MAG: glycosyltransferase [Desulfobacterales bacterium]|nr:glycosyltransferase [Desulfobacterales bacterium]
MAGVSVVVPTLNEADNIDPLMRRISKVALPDGISREIIFVDDNSTDDTAERVLAWASEHPVRLIRRNGEAGGLASAVIAGAHEARHDIILVMDADLSHPPEKIPQMIQPLLDGSHDMVIGSRYVAGGATPEWPFSRKIASKIATLPARLFTDVRDPMAGFFAVARSFVTDLRPDVPGFKIGLEILAVGGDRLQVLEIPIVFHDRFEGFSKMNKGVIVDYLKQVLQLSRIETVTYAPLSVTALGLIGILVNFFFFLFFISSGLSKTSAHLSAITISSLSIFIGAYLLWQKADVHRQLPSSSYFLGLLALVVTASLQGAVFQLLQQYGDLSTYSNYFFASSIGPLFFLLTVIVYIFSGYYQLDSLHKRRIAVVGIIGSAIAIRLLYFGLPELMEQEAYYWNYSQHLDLSYLDHPPMVATIIWLGTLLFGTNEFGVRIGAFVCWFITVFFIYRLTSRIYPGSAALGSIALLALLPLYFGAGLMMTPDAPLLAAWSALLYFLYRTLVEGEAKAWTGVGLSLGCGLISKYTIILLGPAILSFMLIDRDARRWFIKPGPYVAVVLALVLFLPVLIWNFQHEWASFLFQGGQRVAGKTFFTTHRLIGYIVVILTPAGVLAVFHLLFAKGRFAGLINRSLSSFDTPKFKRNYIFMLLMLLWPLTIFTLFSLTREVKLNWTGPLWLAALPFLGYSVMLCRNDSTGSYLKFLQKFWSLTLIVLLVFFAVSLHYVTLGLPKVPYPPGPFLIGWDNLAREIEAIVEQTEEQTGNRPVVVGMDPYQISSGLAFYRTKNGLSDDKKNYGRRGIDETLGWHLFGWHSLMYRYWSDPKDFTGRDILVVASSRIRVEAPYYQKRFTKLKPIKLLPAQKDGQAVRPFYIRLLQGYRMRSN